MARAHLLAALVLCQLPQAFAPPPFRTLGTTYDGECIDSNNNMYDFCCWRLDIPNVAVIDATNTRAQFLTNCKTACEHSFGCVGVGMTATLPTSADAQHGSVTDYYTRCKLYYSEGSSYNIAASGTCETGAPVTDTGAGVLIFENEDPSRNGTGDVTGASERGSGQSVDCYAPTTDAPTVGPSVQPSGQPSVGPSLQACYVEPCWGGCLIAADFCVREQGGVSLTKESCESKSTGVWCDEEDHPLYGVSGDPITVNEAGKKVQFFLPALQDTLLIVCGSTMLYARPKGDKILIDQQQWLESVHITVGGTEVLRTSIKSPTELRRRGDEANETTAAHSTSQHSSDDIDIQKGFHQAAFGLGNVVPTESLPKRANLTSIAVDVEGAAIESTMFLMGGGYDMRVTQSSTTRIGHGWSESVHFSTSALQFEARSTLAVKFSSEELRISNAHLDILFHNVDKQVCTSGLLPELWGVAPLSKESIAMLAPTV